MTPIILASIKCSLIWFESIAPEEIYMTKIGGDRRCPARPIKRETIRKLVLMRIEEEFQRDCALMARLASPCIDFDIFEVSEEDYVDSLRLRGVGDSMFGYEFTSHVDATDEWLDEERFDHAYDDEMCRDGGCDYECWY